MSCLNCKKRKVRCDKQKPCTGCVKNNVEQLCVYVEPSWVDTTVKMAAGTVLANSIQIQDSDEYKLLKSQLENTISHQVSEIESLKRQLAVVQQLGPAAKNVVDFSVLESALGSAVSILRKLRNQTVNPASPEVLDDNFYSMQGFRTKKPAEPEPPVANLYSWLNIIKLDPQLTALWFRITNLQKLYHVYKTTLLGKFSPSDSPQSGDASCGPACGHHKCPVVACEFNLMVEENNRPSTPTPPIKNEQADEDKLHIKMVNDESLDVLTLLQRLWLEIANYGRGNEKLNYQQVSFLVSFYLNLTFQNNTLLYEVESRHMFQFYRREIMGLIRQEGDHIWVDLAVFSPKMSDAEVYGLLKLKGVYLCMLGLIVEESLDILRSGSAGDAVARFHKLFPLEAVHQGLGYKRTNVLGLIRAFLERLSVGQMQNDEISDLMPCIAVLIALLNRFISLYKKDGLAFDVSDSFTAVLGILLGMLDKNDEKLEIWTDPAQVHLTGANSSAARQKELRLHLCHLWSDIMRLINQVTFSMVPIVKHSELLDRRLESFFANFVDAEQSHAHVRYVTKLKADANEDHAELLASLHVYHLISRSFILLRKGIRCLTSTNKVTIADLQKIITETSAWAGEITLTKLRMARYFEVRMVLHYLEFYLTYVIFLQCEEEADDAMVSKFLPFLLAKCLDLNKFLQGSIVQFSKSMSSQYILVAIAENLSRVSHLFVGLLIRFKADSSDAPTPTDSPSPTCLVYALKSGESSALSIPVTEKEEVIRETDRTIQMLQQVLSKENFLRVSKTWRFYMTFVRNSHRMNPAAYAKLHSEVFGSGRLPGACPVMPGATRYPPSSASFSRLDQGCPVFHTASPVPMGNNKPRQSSSVSKCPVDHSTGTPVMTTGKRKCPFDHEALRNMSRSQSFHESHIRGQQDLKSDPDLSPRTETTIQTPPPPRVVHTQAMQPMQLNAFAQPALGSETIDWDTLPNFDFDLMTDESLMVQMNGGDYNNPTIEGMFQ